MDLSLRRIQTEIQKADRDVELCIDALDKVCTRWSAIQIAFTDHSDRLEDLTAAFPGLQSRMELEQLSSCDALIAEIGRCLVLLEHAITNARAMFVKAKQTFRSQEISEAWPYPPTEAPIGDLYVETSNLIDSAGKSLEIRRLALYRLSSESEMVDPAAVSKFLRESQSAVG
jgi:hypothetical protein